MTPMITLRVRCTGGCGKIKEINAPYTDEEFGQKYCDWRDGMLIQRAFPELSPSDRELLKTGICSECFNGK